MARIWGATVKRSRRVPREYVEATARLAAALEAEFPDFDGEVVLVIRKPTPTWRRNMLTVVANDITADEARGVLTDAIESL